MRSTLFLVALLTVALTAPAHARKKKVEAPPVPAASTALEALMSPVDGTFGRVSSTDLEGDPVLEAGGSLTLADIDGPGVIDRLWIAVEGSDTFWRDIVVRITWDGASNPAVEAPIGDLFAVGPGARQQLQAIPMSVQGGGRSFTSLWKMPFASKATIVLDNEGVHDTRVLAYEIDYRAVPVSAEPLHFHARYTQANPPEPDVPITVLRTSGLGHYVGMSLAVQSTAPGNVGTGNVAFSVDGEVARGPGTQPLMRYFGNLFGANQVRGPWVGATLAEGNRVKARTAFYRFQVHDPVPFTSSIEITVDHGPTNQRTDRVSAVVYWYQTGSASPFSKFATARDRRWPAPSDEELALWKRADDVDDEIIDAYRRMDLDRARTLLEELIELEPDNAIATYNLACIYSLHEEQDKALHMLESAIDLGFSELSFARHDPDLKALHGHARFKKLVGLSE